MRDAYMSNLQNPGFTERTSTNLGTLSLTTQMYNNDIW